MTHESHIVAALAAIAGGTEAEDAIADEAAKASSEGEADAIAEAIWAAIEAEEAAFQSASFDQPAQRMTIAVASGPWKDA